MNKSRLASAFALSLTLASSPRAYAAGAAPLPSPAPAPQATPSTTAPSVPSTPPAASDAKKDEARTHFELGLSHFDREEWDAALQEFIVSRGLFATRSATKDAALCLRRLNRFDEALDMWESLEREFGASLTPSDKTLAEGEMADLRKSVGFLDVRGAEPGATIRIDGRERGTFPAKGPLRVSAGTHVLVVSKDGFTPFEAKPGVAGQQVVAVDAKLGALTRGGRLRVSEQSGRPFDVVVDGAVVGKTPWEGTVTAGRHDVALRGAGDVGTQPAEATVKFDQATTLTLLAEPLEASSRVVPTPAGASVAIDDVVVGRGIWDGRLRAGAHRVEVAAEGFLPYSRKLTLEKGQREVIEATLERDPSSPLWRAANPPRFFVEASGAVLLAPSLGGDVTTACTGSCSSGLGVGGGGTFHGGYQLGSGLGFAIDAGYLYVQQSLSNRKTTLTPQGETADTGTVSDSLSLSGLLLGASASYHRGATWPILLRLGVDVLLASERDGRKGTFTDHAGSPFSVNVAESASAPYLVFAPEARIGRKIGDHLEVNVGVTVYVLTGLSKATWQDQGNVLAGADGVGTFGAQQITGSSVVVVLPGIGGRYEL